MKVKNKVRLNEFYNIINDFIFKNNKLYATNIILLPDDL